MGLEYPYLATMSAAAFIAIVFGVLFTELWINYQLKLTPEMEGFVTYEWINTTDARITITIRLVKGTPIEYNSILLPTNLGAVKLFGPGTYSVKGVSTITLSYEGFDGTLNHGQEAKIILDIDNAAPLFTPGRDYTLLVDFDAGGFTLTFQPPTP